MVNRGLSYITSIHGFSLIKLLCCSFNEPMITEELETKGTGNFFMLMSYDLLQNFTFIFLFYFLVVFIHFNFLVLLQHQSSAPRRILAIKHLR